MTMYLVLEHGLNAYEVRAGFFDEVLAKAQAQVLADNSTNKIEVKPIDINDDTE